MRITRRQFIKVISATAAAMGLGQLELEKMAEVLAKPSALGTVPVLWIQNQVCGGCITAFAGVFAGEVDYTDLNGDNFYDTTGLVQAKALNSPGYTAGSNASSSTVDDVLIDVIDLKFMNVIMGPAGELAASILQYYRDTAAGGSFVAIIDGTIPSEDKYCGLGYIDNDEIASPTDVQAIAQKAALVIAYGTCASFGGIPAGMNRKYDATNGRYEGGTTTSTAFAGPVPDSWAVNSYNLLQKVIRIPTCPGHPEALLLTVVDALETLGSAYGGRLPTGSPYKPTLAELVANIDSVGRPKYALVLGKILGSNTAVPLYAQSIHYTCPRLLKYNLGVFDSYFGDTRKGCLANLGCQGISVYTPCMSLKWNREVSSNTTCTAQGVPCVGCGAPGFPDRTLNLQYK